MALAVPDVLRSPRVVAEIGCNHRGEVETAERLIDAAAFCGATFAKFQKRRSRELLTPEQYDAPYDNPNSYGRTYGEHRERLEFSIETHRRLKAYCEGRRIGYATSVWDVTSAREIASLGCDYVKVPSACNNHVDLLKVLRDECRSDVHVSLGMTTSEEEDVARRAVLVVPEAASSCTRAPPGTPSRWPTPASSRSRASRSATWSPGVAAPVGFSGHHLGIAIDLAAPILGATWIERHFTLDRTWKGTDHAASLEPSGLQRLVRDLQALSEAWKRKPMALAPGRGAAAQEAQVSRGPAGVTSTSRPPRRPGGRIVALVPAPRRIQVDPAQRTSGGSPVVPSAPGRSTRPLVRPRSTRSG